MTICVLVVPPNNKQFPEVNYLYLWSVYIYVSTNINLDHCDDERKRPKERVYQFIRKKLILSACAIAIGKHTTSYVIMLSMLFKLHYFSSSLSQRENHLILSIEWYRCYGFDSVINLSLLNCYTNDIARLRFEMKN